MNEYEVFVEDINSCGGEQHAKKELLEIEAESPEAYVKENGRFPIMDISENSSGDTVIVTGDGNGNFLPDNNIKLQEVLVRMLLVLLDIVGKYLEQNYHLFQNFS